MKYKLLILLVLLVFTQGQGQTKLGLIFAIGEYPAEGGWGEISSLKDVGYIQTTLEKQGFQKSNITTVADGGATKQGIENALKALISKANPGDIAVIHFSSHGNQIADDNNDETDGYDESIVAYDAILPKSDLPKEEYEKVQTSYFRDDEFGMYIEQLRAKLGDKGDVVVFIDACHSGSGTRGTAKVRGGKPALKPIGYIPSGTAEKDNKSVFKEGNASRGDESKLATYVVFSAAMAEELNYETYGDDHVSMGSLTYAISKAFENLNAGVTYRSLFAKILGLMKEKVPGQTPVLEGNGIDRALFGGKFVDQKPYIEVETISNLKEAILKGGRFAGLDSGAKVALYPSGTADPSKSTALAIGTVKKADSYTCVVMLDKDIKATQAAQIWAFLTEPVYNIEPVNIAFQSVSRGSVVQFSALETKVMTAALKTLPLVSFTGKPDLIISKGTVSDTVKIAENGYVFSTAKNLAADTVQLKKEINRYAQYQFLQSLKIADPGITAEIKLVPVVNGVPDTSAVSAVDSERPYEFKVGEKLSLWIKNPGNSAIFVNILDMQPDGYINPIMPNIKQRIYPRDLRIEAGASRLFNNYVITIGPPFGMEIFKVFVSTTEINMEGLTTPGLGARAGGLKVLENLVKNSSDITTRGAETENLGAAEGSVYNLLFKINPK